MRYSQKLSTSTTSTIAIIILNVIIILQSIVTIRETQAWSNTSSSSRTKSIFKKHRLFQKRASTCNKTNHSSSINRSGSSSSSNNASNNYTSIRSSSSNRSNRSTNYTPKVKTIVNPVFSNPTTSRGISSHHYKESFLRYSNLSQDEQKYTSAISDCGGDGDDGGRGEKEERDTMRAQPSIDNTSSSKKVDDWFGKWFEDNLHDSFVQWKEFIGRGDGGENSSGGSSGSDKDVRLDKKGKSSVSNVIRHETDSEMPGSTITYFSSCTHDSKKYMEDITKDIEVLPSNAQMVDLTKLQEEKRKVQLSSLLKNGDKENYAIAEKSHFPHRHRRHYRLRRHQRRGTKKDKEKTIFELLGSTSHLQRMDVDIRHLCLSIAGNIDDQEQWKEYLENSQGEGLSSILQCIKDVATEIRMGVNVYDNMDNISILDRATRRENAFVVACSAVKVLRDLCSIDQNWASFITHEILSSDGINNGNEDDGVHKGEKSKSVSFLEDLTVMLKYANEADMFHSRKIFRLRRELRAARGITRFGTRRQRRHARKRCILYINQLLLGMAFASDKAIHSFRSTDGLIDSIVLSSSYTAQQKLRGRWYRYPYEKAKRIKDKILRRDTQDAKQAFLEAAKIQGGFKGKIQVTSNKLLAALGHNIFVPKVPGQRGLRILSLDGGGSRGVASIAIIKALVDEVGVEVCDLFDFICGTSTGAIIAFLVGLRLESTDQAKNRYDELVEKIFVKSSLSTPMLFLTTAAYSEVPFKKIMEDILGDHSMLDSRADPRVPYVFAVSSKMSSTTNKVSLFRNYNYEKGEKPDKFTVDPQDARRNLGFKPNSLNSDDNGEKHKEGSRHEGSFRVLQRAALRATTAAPTVFKPVVMAGDVYSDGGIVASNPTAIAIHEARTLFPDIPIELCVSCGTGEFISQTKQPSFGWDGIISQIVKSATDTAKTHWVLEDILGQGTPGPATTKYFRFDPVIGTPEDFPIDATDSKRLEELSQLTTNYMKEEEQLKKLQDIKKILNGQQRLF